MVYISIPEGSFDNSLIFSNKKINWSDTFSLLDSH